MTTDRRYVRPQRLTTAFRSHDVNGIDFVSVLNAGEIQLQNFNLISGMKDFEKR